MTEDDETKIKKMIEDSKPSSLLLKTIEDTVIKSIRYGFLKFDKDTIKPIERRVDKLDTTAKFLFGGLIVFIPLLAIVVAYIK